MIICIIMVHFNLLFEIYLCLALFIMIFIEDRLTGRYILHSRYKSARLFGKNLSVWDFFLKVTMDFNQSLQHLLAAPGGGGGSNAANSAKNSPMSSPIHRRGQNIFNTLESPRPGRRFSSSASGGGLANMRLDSPRKSAQQPIGVSTLSRANQFRR